MKDGLVAAYTHPVRVYDDALRDAGRGAPSDLRVEWEDGRVSALRVDRWLACPTAAEVELLAIASPPVLDVGCGPGRMVLALSQRGVPALGVDVAPGAVQLGRRRGAPILNRSIFGQLPGEGWWSSALLLDGSAGIGGAPPSLLRRLTEILRPGGEVLLELEEPGVPSVVSRLRLLTPADTSKWLPWARIGVDGLGELASETGYSIDGLWRRHDRWFARLLAPRSPA